jgi:hypothetical protein
MELIDDNISAINKLINPNPKHSEADKNSKASIAQHASI